MVQQVIDAYWNDDRILRQSTKVRLAELVREHLRTLIEAGYDGELYLGPCLQDEKDPFNAIDVKFKYKTLVGRFPQFNIPGSKFLHRYFGIARFRQRELTPDEIPFERFRFYHHYHYNLMSVARNVERAVESLPSYGQNVLPNPNNI